MDLRTSGSMTSSPVVPPQVADSTVTSLSDLIAAIPSAALKNHVEEQVEILDKAKIDLDEAMAYYSSLLHDREAFKKLGADYSSPSNNDYMRLRLLALYYIGLKHFSVTGNHESPN
jgi:hypothetical protein